MQRKKVALVHTSASLVPVFEQLCKEKNLDVELMHIEDSSLIEDVISEGELTEDVAQRVRQRLADVEKMAADYIMVTCSSIGPAVEAAEHDMHKPVLRIDRPLADQAINIGSRIGVVATLVTTMVPTTELIQRRAKESGKEIHLQAELCKGAFEALFAGDIEKHDAAVCEAVTRLAKEVDVVVLAQASMARAVAKLDPEKLGVPVLSSPSLAVDYLASVL